MPEYLYLVNKNNQPINKKMGRVEVHRRGIWHRVLHVGVVNNKKEVLRQLKNLHRDIFPGYWDLVCGGM